MSDDIDNTEIEETEESEGDLYDLLHIPRPDGTEGDAYSDIEEDADNEMAKQDKMEKKLSAKMDDMQRKFENTLVRERISKFQDSADDLQKDLFKTIAGDVKDMETLDKALKLVDQRAAKMKAEAEKYRSELEKQAQEQVSRAWGTGPMGTPTPHTADYEEELYKRVREGDDQAAFELIIGDDWPSFD